MAFAIPLSGDDLPRRRRVPGRTSTLQLGEDESGGVGASTEFAQRRGAPAAYPAEPAGGGYFGPDPTPVMSQKERLAAERKREYNEMLAKQAGARRPGAAAEAAALRASAFELPPQQPQYQQAQAPGWSGLAPAPQQPVFDAKKQYGLELQAQIAEKEARKRAERLEARGLAPPPPQQQQQQFYAPPPPPPAESGWLDAPSAGGGGGYDEAGYGAGGAPEPQRWEPSPAGGGGSGYDDGAYGGEAAWGGGGGGGAPAPPAAQQFGSAYPYAAPPPPPPPPAYAPPSPPPRQPVRGAGLHELVHGAAPGGGAGWGGAYARGGDPAEAYRRELAAQVEEQRQRREAEKREAREREAREEAQNEAYLRAKAFAAAGGGAIDNMAAGVAARGGGGGITVAAPRGPPPPQRAAAAAAAHNPFAPSAPPPDPFAHRMGRGRVPPPDDSAAARAAQAEQHAAELAAQIEERARARAAAAAAAAAADAADEARAAYQAAQAADAYERGLAAKGAAAEEDSSMIAANREQMAGGGAPPPPRQGRRTPPPPTGPWAPRVVPPAPRVSDGQAGAYGGGGPLRGSLVGGAALGRGSVDMGGGMGGARSSATRDEIAALRAALAAREAELEAARAAAAEAEERAQAARERAFGGAGMPMPPPFMPMQPPWGGMPPLPEGAAAAGAPYGMPPPYGFYGYPPPYGYAPPMAFAGAYGAPAPPAHGAEHAFGAHGHKSATPEPERSVSPTAFPAGVGRTRPARPRGGEDGSAPEVDASLAAVSTFVFPSSGREWAATPATRGAQRPQSPMPPPPPRGSGSGAASPELPAASSRHDLRVPAEMAGASPFASLRPQAGPPAADDVPQLSAPPMPPQRAPQPPPSPAAAAAARLSRPRQSAAGSEATDVDALEAVDDALTRAVDAAEWHAEAMRTSYDGGADAAAREALLQRFVAGAAAAAPPPPPSAALVGDAAGRRVSTGAAAQPPPRDALPPRPSTAATGAQQSARPYRA